MHSDIFLELSIVIGLAAVVAAVIKIFRQPPIIGYILTGLLIGPYALNVLHSEEILNTLSQFGIALLLFIIGLGLNPKVVREVGKTAAYVGIGQIVFTVLVASGVGRILGFNSKAALFIAIALAFSSTIIVLKILSDKKETTALYGKIATGFLLVQDVVATLALIFIAGMGEGGIPLPKLSLTIGYAILLAVGLTICSQIILPKLSKFLSDSQEFLFLFALAWGFGIASIFVKAGLSVEVGALFAGVALAPQLYAQEVASRLKPLRDFFIILFFIVLGAELELANFTEVFMPALILSAVVLIGNPIIVTTIMGLLGYTKKTSFKTGLTVSQISEFSLIFILLAATVGQVSSEVVSIVTIVALVTIAGSTYLMLFDEKLYGWFERYLSLFERRKVKYSQVTDRDSADIVLFGLERGGREFIKEFQKMKKKFIVIDYDPEAIDYLEHNSIPHAYGDATDIEFLDEIAISKAKLVVSTVQDFEANLFITTQVHALNKNAIIIPHSNTPEEALRLYAHGATYVMMPRYIGSERISSMIDKHGLKRAGFTAARDKHLKYVEQHLQ